MMETQYSIIVYYAIPIDAILVAVMGN